MEKRLKHSEELKNQIRLSLSMSNYSKKEVEVEKVVDNLRVISTGYKLWQVLLGMFIGIGFGWFICKDILKKDGELYSQKSQEMKRLK